VRPSFDLRVGVTTLGRRLSAQMAARKITKTAFVCRSWLAPQVERAFPGAMVSALAGTDDLLFVNGAALFFKGEMERFLRQLNDQPALESGGRLVAARVRAEDGRKLVAALAESWGPGAAEAVPGPPSWPRGFKPKPVAEPIRFLSRPWDLVHANEATLIDDFALTRPGKEPALPVASPGAHLVKKNRILSRPGSRVMPGAVLDASTGPIILGEGVRILHNAVVLGPAYIGPNSLIKVGAKIYGGTSIGPVCKVGGEVEGSILHGYANKQHDGFLGHSYLAEWTNIGAGTDTSDLKNNYGRVKAWAPGGEIDTGLTFAGLVLGDHAKCGIGTMFNTGTVVGVMANIFGAGYPPKHVPSFSWGGAAGLEAYDLERALAVAALVTARRQKSFEPIDEALYRKIFADTAAHRLRGSSPAR
jgi:UDP-N-acetylglucosamine diphosphorylase/glucosamine-1-phosphate N-acetyltransferase